MTNIEKECVRLWQQCMSIIWGKNCCWCRQYGDLTGHHIIGRSKYLTKFSLMNGIGLCHECHRKIHDDAVGQAQFINFLEDSWPDLFLFYSENLPIANQDCEGWSKSELKDIKAKLKTFIVEHK